MYPTIDAEFDVLGYDHAQEEAIMYGQAILGERQLWCAIIEQAFIDVGVIADLRGIGRGNTGPTDIKAMSRAKQCYEDAARWLLHGKQDFVYVCTMAGMSPSVIRRIASQKLGKA